MAALADVLDGAVAGTATFDPPVKAAKATAGYRVSVRRLLTVVRRFEAFARGGGATGSPPAFRRHQRAFSRAWREASLDSSRMRSRADVPLSPAERAAGTG